MKRAFQDFLEDDLHCTICCEPKIPPYMQCENGHVTCSACGSSDRLGRCAFCRGTLARPRIRALENLADLAIGQVACRNQRFGCTVSTLPSKALDHLMRSCVYRQAECPLCAEMVSVCALLAHIRVCGASGCSSYVGNFLSEGSSVSLSPFPPEGTPLWDIVHHSRRSCLTAWYHGTVSFGPGARSERRDVVLSFCERDGYLHALARGIGPEDDMEGIKTKINLGDGHSTTSFETPLSGIASTDAKTLVRARLCLCAPVCLINKASFLTLDIAGVGN